MAESATKSVQISAILKKRLADLLQKEMQKFTPTEGESVIEIAAEVVAENASPDASEPTADTTATKYPNPPKIELEATVEELRKKLAESQKKEASFQQQISSFKAALFEQESSVERLEKELDETKKTALHLAEANSQLIEEINGLKQVKEPVTALVKEVVKEPYNPLSYRKSHRSSERLQERPTGSNENFADNTWLYD